jgi:hypothetical protein
VVKTLYRECGASRLLGEKGPDTVFEMADGRWQMSNVDVNGSCETHPINAPVPRQSDHKRCREKLPDGMSLG